MTAEKMERLVKKAGAVLFTSIIAPLLVNVVVKDLVGTDADAVKAESYLTMPLAVLPGVSPSEPETPPLAPPAPPGPGWNEPTLVQRASEDLLSNVPAVGQTPAETSRGASHVSPPEGKSVVVYWQVLRCKKDGKIRESVHHRDVGVEMTTEPGR